MYVDIQKAYKIPSTGFIDTAKILIDSEHKIIKEQKVEQDCWTSEGFCLEATHKKAEWRLNYTSKNLNDAEIQSNKTPKDKKESENVEDNTVEVSSRKDTEILLERQEIINQNTKYGICDTIIYGDGNKKAKNYDLVTDAQKSDNTAKESESDEEIFYDAKNNCEESGNYETDSDSDE